jgi:hypothetical protein
MPKKATSWVVYMMTLHNKPTGQKAVCTQAEWDELQAARPGYHQLVQSGFTSERDAELIARGTSGDTAKRSWMP